MSQDLSSPKSTHTRLPVGWESRHDAKGRAYYIDNNAKITTWRRPSPEGGELQVLAAGSDELPAGWEQRRNSEGQVYFVDHNTHTNTWVDPRSTGNEFTDVESSDLQQPPPHPSKLPKGWEMRPSKKGPWYFIDHNTKTTTWDDPRLRSSLEHVSQDQS